MTLKKCKPNNRVLLKNIVTIPASFRPEGEIFLHAGHDQDFSALRSSRDYYSGKVIANSVRTFFKMVIRSLSFYGECIYEIVELLNPATSNLEAIAFSFIQH